MSAVALPIEDQDIVGNTWPGVQEGGKSTPLEDGIVGDGSQEANSTGLGFGPVDPIAADGVADGFHQGLSLLPGRESTVVHVVCGAVPYDGGKP